MPRPLATLVALGLAVLGIAACGGDGEDEYGDEFRRLSERIAALGQEVGEAIETAGDATDQELADRFQDFATELGNRRRRLDDLEPPEELADEHDELVAAAREVERSLADIAEAAGESDPDAAREATIQLIRRSNDLREARQALSRAVQEQE